MGLLLEVMLSAMEVKIVSLTVALTETTSVITLMTLLLDVQLLPQVIFGNFNALYSVLSMLLHRVST